MKTVVLAIIAVIVFLGLFRVDVSLLRKSAVDKRAEALSDNELVSAVSNFIGRDDPAYLWAEMTMLADCYRQADVDRSGRARSEDLDACKRAMYEARLEYPFLSIEVTSRLDGAR
jgi:hypothetical protein